MNASVTKKPKITACDRCYGLKERCDRISPSASCARCHRLGLGCLTVRPVRPAGRRVHRTDSVSRLTLGSSKTLQQQCQSSIDACLNMLNLQPEEKELLMFLLSQPESLNQYVACPSFQAVQQQLFSVQLSAALPSLKDALLACAITLKQSRTAMVTDTTFTVQYILKAMNVLRSLPVLSSQDVVLCNALGGLLAFSISSAIGVGVPDICRHCLGTTTPFVETTVSDAQNDPWKSFLILLETMDCLVYRQKPILRIRVPSSAVVDCRLGLRLPLLPYYHDLCVISNSLINITDINVLACLQKQLDDIRCIVEPWRPSHLDQLVEEFDSTEIVHLLAQAKVYRLGALLLGHRLRFPFGQKDAQAEIWSKEIMMELEIAKGVTKRSMRFVTLPFIIAAVEVRDKNLRFKTLELVDDCVDHYAQFLQKATKTFLSRIWQERDLNLTTCWFDSVYKPCPVLDSINATCFSG
ncbi:hypothetical protein OCU04_011782 [Sclerotinia nivalis]|uniref:Zn(2)-C6 fungal-type domain-containing protein n=1 Tax=Sclerotinia nivalis TaxID=352851 RepID=A0A9X0AAD0_9HELO|nr:hypothetical protein OCU04_011782 [Sclerotinia nivalis]